MPESRRAVLAWPAIRAYPQPAILVQIRDDSMLLLIDNYDSFTFNLVQYLRELGAEVLVRRNDAIDLQEAMALRPSHIVVSPGPGTPDDSGICLGLIAAAAETATPLLGVCLGHQAIGQVFGGRVIRAPEPRHGKTSPMRHDGTGVLAGLPNPFTATRYHSLIVEEASLPAALRPTAYSEDGLIMAMEHRTLPISGVQFHPESIASEDGHAILRNFLTRGPVELAA